MSGDYSLEKEIEITPAMIEAGAEAIRRRMGYDNVIGPTMREILAEDVLVAAFSMPTIP